ncbi:substrate import-associated zinc metallohydrolase lipoprotein [Winogradskyella schleiferi]|uniref:substrate import-associated zinc metallohydrolase lipoprotein n=1 Tax=Winogradskyella schleiferi TaxID=2686078 RepID=UPI0015BD5EBF|nr:substrate import-associated zinc metallohydrolase lipoprotein [Winogradskyella schleiferi]
MNNRFKILPLVFLTVFITLLGCDGSEDNVSGSQIDTSTPILNELDIWLRSNFVAPYNIDIQYQWDVNDTSVNRYLHPPFPENAEKIAQVLLDVWIEPYNAVGGENFIKNIAPREFVLAGGFNYNPGVPTITLGIAEAGARITLFNLDELDFSTIAYESDVIGDSDDFDVQRSVVGPISTVHHEYGHILNQTIPYNTAFDVINPGNYTAQWFNRTNEEARSLGYITNYASNQSGEDFVEMIAQMLIRSREQWDDLVNNIGIYDPDTQDYELDVDGNRIINTEAINIIREKEQIVVEYFAQDFGIDLYELQALAHQALLDSIDD